MFVSDDGPFWLETAPASATFLGAQEPLFDVGDGAATGLSPHLPMRLVRDGGGIAGEIGHIARRFRPAGADAIDARWSGRWAAPDENARFEIDGDEMHGGVGPLLGTVKLRPLSPRLALAIHDDRGPWRQRVCLAQDGDEIRLVTNRSRILRFRREP